MTTTISSHLNHPSFLLTWNFYFSQFNWGIIKFEIFLVAFSILPLRKKGIIIYPNHSSMELKFSSLKIICENIYILFHSMNVFQTSQAMYVSSVEVSARDLCFNKLSQHWKFLLMFSSCLMECLPNIHIWIHSLSPFLLNAKLSSDCEYLNICFVVFQ